MDDMELENEYKSLNKIPTVSNVDSISDIPESTKTWVIGMLPKSQLRFLTFRKKYSDFSTAATTLNSTLFSLPKYCEIITCWFNVTTAFSGTGITGYTISIGPSGSETTLQTAQSVTSTGLKSAVGTDFTTNRPIYSTTTGTTIVARATSTGANLSAGTTGSCDIFVAYINWAENL